MVVKAGHASVDSASETSSLRGSRSKSNWGTFRKPLGGPNPLRLGNVAVNSFRYDDRSAEQAWPAFDPSASTPDMHVPPLPVMWDRVPLDEPRTPLWVVQHQTPPRTARKKVPPLGLEDPPDTRDKDPRPITGGEAGEVPGPSQSAPPGHRDAKQQDEEESSGEEDSVTSPAFYRKVRQRAQAWVANQREEFAGEARVKYTELVSRAYAKLRDTYPIVTRNVLKRIEGTAKNNVARKLNAELHRRQIVDWDLSTVLRDHEQIVLREIRQARETGSARSRLASCHSEAAPTLGTIPKTSLSQDPILTGLHGKGGRLGSASGAEQMLSASMTAIEMSAGSEGKRGAGSGVTGERAGPPGRVRSAGVVLGGAEEMDERYLRKRWGGEAQAETSGGVLLPHMPGRSAAGESESFGSGLTLQSSRMAEKILGPNPSKNRIAAGRTRSDNVQASGGTKKGRARKKGSAAGGESKRGTVRRKRKSSWNETVKEGEKRSDEQSRVLERGQHAVPSSDNSGAKPEEGKAEGGGTSPVLVHTSTGDHPGVGTNDGLGLGEKAGEGKDEV